MAMTYRVHGTSSLSKINLTDSDYSTDSSNSSMGSPLNSRYKEFINTDKEELELINNKNTSLYKKEILFKENFNVIN